MGSDVHSARTLQHLLSEGLEAAPSSLVVLLACVKFAAPPSIFLQSPSVHLMSAANPDFSPPGCVDRLMVTCNQQELQRTLSRVNLCKVLGFAASAADLLEVMSSRRVSAASRLSSELSSEPASTSRNKLEDSNTF